LRIQAHQFVIRRPGHNRQITDKSMPTIHKQ
jgi:hypothetical protein